MSAADTIDAIRADMIRIAGMRTDLEQIAARRPGERICLAAIRAADDSLVRLARRLSEAYAEAKGGGK